MQTIAKVAFINDNGVFKELIQEIINNKDFRKFKIIFSANIVETKISTTKKNVKNLLLKIWKSFFNF